MYLHIKLPRITASYILYSILLFSVVSAIEVQAAGLQLVSIPDKPPYIFSLEIDKVEKLAGLKLALTYPEEVMLFKTATKSPDFNSFMHVINDKKPGRLIVVMASAKGVSGSNLKLFELTFSPVSRPSSTPYLIESTECQLMSEALKEIPCTTSTTTVPVQE